ncbi:10387_t:CDS:2, partial [Cetraspora pellucida]
YYNDNARNKDAMLIKSHNRDVDNRRKFIDVEKKILREKVNVYILTFQPKNSDRTLVSAGWNEKEKTQSEYIESDSSKAMLNMLLYLSKREEFKNKSGLKMGNDITNKININSTEFENLEDMAYAGIINELDDSMGANNVMVDAELIIRDIKNVDYYLNIFKPIQTKKSNIKGV